MYDVDSIDLVSGEVIARDADRVNEISLTYYELMQFTGLRDKNGKEIYEGDVVRLEPAAYHDLKTTVGEIVWDLSDARFVISEIGSPHIFSVTKTYAHWLEVLGNKYEHPELFKDI